MAITAPANFQSSKTEVPYGGTVHFTWQPSTGNFEWYCIMGAYYESFLNTYVDASATSCDITIPKELESSQGSSIIFSIQAGRGSHNSPDEQSDYADDSITIYTFVLSTPGAPSPVVASPTEAFAGEHITVTWGLSPSNDFIKKYLYEERVDGEEWTVFGVSETSNPDILPIVSRPIEVKIPERAEKTWGFRICAIDIVGNVSPFGYASVVIKKTGFTLPDGGRLELLENRDEQPVYPITLLEGVFRREDKKSLKAILETGGAVQGPAGKGVPAGGAAGQVLSKKSAADYDTQWIDPPAGGAGAVGPAGADGKSAYQIALENGFTGTVTEWLASLQGEPGSPGVTMEQVNTAIQEALGTIEAALSEV